jgi:hypothetical protein
VRHGGLQDISAFLEYRFYEPVLYLDSDETFPSSKEKPGWWVGVANNVGDAMTFKILTEDSHKMIHRSVLRPAKDDRFKNKRVRFDPEPDPDSKDEEKDTVDPELTFARQRLKIDQGLSRRRKRKQIRYQLRRPHSVLPDEDMDQSTPESTNPELNVEEGETEIELERESESKLANKAPAQSRVYDVEEVKLNGTQPDTDDKPTDGGSTKVIDGQEPEHTPEGIDDEQDGQPPIRRSTRNRGAMDRLSSHTKGVHSSLKSLVKGFILGLAVHSN